MIWTAFLENQGLEPVSVAPTAILRRIPQLQPYDHESVAKLILEGGRNSRWARAGRVGGDVITLAAFLAASKQVRWGDGLTTALTAALAFGPYIVQRLTGAAPPVAANFERLAWVSPLQLGSGESGSVHLFTAPWANPQPVSVTITIGVAPMRRSLQ